MQYDILMCKWYYIHDEFGKGFPDVPKSDTSDWVYQMVSTGENIVNGD